MGKLPRNVRRHGRGFRAVVDVDGHRLVSPVMDDVAGAERWLAAFRRARRSEMPAMTLAQGMDMIEAELVATGGRPATLASYRAHSRPLLKWFGRGTGLHTVTQRDVRAYLAERVAAGVSPAVAWDKELWLLKRMLRLARDHGLVLPDDPFAGVRPPRRRSQRFAALSPEQVAGILARIRGSRYRTAERDADMVEVLFLTGLRRAELARLRPGDVDWEAGVVSVDGKTGARALPVGEALRGPLERLLRKPLTVRTIEKAFTRWRERLSLRDFSPHVLRHSFATAAARLLSPLDLQATLGHSSPSQTARYYHHAPRAVADAQTALLPRQPPPEQ